jgi:rubrerythrin
MEDTLNNNPNVQSSDTPIVSPTSDVNSSVPDTAIPDENPEDLDSMWLRWKCLNCGYVYEGVRELKKCPRCNNEDPDKFTDVD